MATFKWSAVATEEEESLSVPPKVTLSKVEWAKKRAQQQRMELLAKQGVSTRVQGRI
jgi:hypothetical protein